MYINLQVVDSCFLKGYLVLPEHSHLPQLPVTSPSKHPYRNAAYCNVLRLGYLRLALEREQIMPAKPFSRDTTASAPGHLPAQLFFGKKRVKSHCSDQCNKAGKTEARAVASLIASASSVPLLQLQFLPPPRTPTVSGLPRKGRDVLLSPRADKGKISHVNKPKGPVGDADRMLQDNSFTQSLITSSSPQPDSISSAVLANCKGFVSEGKCLE